MAETIHICPGCGRVDDEPYQHDRGIMLPDGSPRIQRGTEQCGPWVEYIRVEEAVELIADELARLCGCGVDILGLSDSGLGPENSVENEARRILGLEEDNDG